MRLRTLFLVAISLAALVGGLWYWRKTQAVATRRLAAWEEQRQIEATEAILERQLDWPRTTLPLVQFAEAIADNSGLAVEIERLALEVEGKDLACIRIDIPRGTLSFGSVLRLGLSPHGLCYDIEDGRLTITTPTVSSDRTSLRTVVYPLPQPELASSDVDEETWQDLVENLVEASEWGDLGGPGHCQAVPGGLVVVHNQHVHRQLRHLFRSLSQLSSPPESLAPVPLLPPMDQESLRSIHAALRQPAGIDFHNVPLSEAVSELAWQHNLAIVLNATKLIEAGISPDVKVTIDSKGGSLQSLLRRMLGPIRITFTFRDAAVVVTTHEDAESPESMATVAYPVHDLVAEQGGRDYGPLVDLISTVVAPESWQDVGGPAQVGQQLDGWLLISQEWHVHEQIERLLNDLRRSSGADGVPRELTMADSPLDGRLRAALDRPLAIRFNQTPLADAAQWLAMELGIPVVLDEQALDGERFKPWKHVTCDLEAAPLRNQLRLLLEPLKLACIVKDETLTITTDHVSRSPDNLSIRVYDVRPLVDPECGLADGERLRETITSLIAPGYWQEVGGAGAAVDYRGLLVVRQSDAVHHELELILQAVEQHCLPLLSPESATDAQHPRVVKIGRAPGDGRVERLLDQAANVSFVERPLDQALAELAATYEVPLVLQRRDLEEAGIDPAKPVSLQAEGISLQSVLRQILEPVELTCLVRDSALLVTTDHEAISVRQLTAYRVGDLVAGPRSADAEQIRRMIYKIVAPEWWEQVGGPGDAKVLGGWLFVAQSPDAQFQIEQLLAQIRSSLAGEPTGSPLVESAELRSTQAVRAALDREIALHFDETPLHQVVAHIKRELDVPLVLCGKRLEEAGINFDAPVTCQLAAAPLRDQLRLLLDPLALAFTVRHEVLMVTTPEDLESPNRMPIGLYDVRRLVNPEAGITSASELADMIDSLVEQHTWAAYGGSAGAFSFRGLLAVRQTDPIHQRIERLLAALAGHCLPAAGQAADSALVIDIDTSPAEQRIERVLAAPVDVAIGGQPLADALRQLAAEHGLPLVIDEQALNGAGSYVKRPVSHRAAGQTLGTVLDVLVGAECGHTVRNGVLLVTDKYVAKDSEEIRLYRVDDLLSARPQLDLAGLAERIKLRSKGAWIDHGGEGVVREVGGRWLAVAGGWRLQHQVADFLTELRTETVPQRELERRALAAQREQESRKPPPPPLLPNPEDDPFAPPIGNERGNP